MIGSEEKQAVLKLESGNKTDAQVAEKAYSWPIIWIDYWGLGEKSPYLVDNIAKRTGEHSTAASMIGANWQKYKDDNGEVKEFYGRSVPLYSKSLDVFTNIEEKIKRDEAKEQYLQGLILAIGTDAIFDLVHASALDRCKAFLLMEGAE
ncbi:MAG: hypothetical protein WC677_08615 [Clostridia bacterium]|jgi:hypothetical protein